MVTLPRAGRKSFSSGYRLRYDAATVSSHNTFDVVVVGAGVFGAWTAWHLAKRGQRVALMEAYGPAHSRSSSGGETRIIRMGYGTDELYTRWSQRSLLQWKKFFEATRQPLFLETGVLWMAGDEDARWLPWSKRRYGWALNTAAHRCSDQWDLAASTKWRQVMARRLPRANLCLLADRGLEKYSRRFSVRESFLQGRRCSSSASRREIRSLRHRLFRRGCFRKT